MEAKESLEYRKLGLMSNTSRSPQSHNANRNTKLKFVVCMFYMGRPLPGTEIKAVKLCPGKYEPVYILSILKICARQELKGSKLINLMQEVWKQWQEAGCGFTMARYFVYTEDYE